MDRSNRSSISQAFMGRHQRSLLVAALLALVAAGGCANGLANVMYIFQGRNDVKAQYAGLSGKRVAVVCRPLATMQYRNANPAKDMGQYVSNLLKENVPKIQLVSRNEVDKWIDENESNFDDFAAIGEALKADVVVGIELESFTIYQGSTTLYQGKADAQVAVYDIKKGGEQVWSTRLPQVVYPPNTAVASSDMPENEFRRRFMTKLAEHVARYFYDHDSSVDFAMDAEIASGRQ
jgi:hypothetical protein